MAFEDLEGSLHIAHVEYICVVILVADGKIEGLHWVPRDGIAGEIEYGSVERHAGA
jgi:hypothetical protein